MSLTPPQKIHHPKWHKPLYALGDNAILNRPLTGFLCSQTYPATVVLPIYRWARTMRKSSDCVISGFHSSLECDVREILSDGHQPIVWVFARSLPKRLSATIAKNIADGKLLIISPTAPNQNRPTAKSAYLRNQCVIALATQTIIGYATPNGTLAELVAAHTAKITSLPAT